MIIVSPDAGRFHPVEPNEGYVQFGAIQRLYPQNTFAVSYDYWDKKLLNIDSKITFILSNANPERVSNMKHEDIKQILMQCQGKQTIAWLVENWGGMKYFLPEIRTINSLNGFIILEHDKAGLEDNLQTIGSEPIQNYLNDYSYIAYPVLYTYNNYFREDKCSRVFVPYAWFGKERGGYASLNIAMQLSQRYNLEVVIPMWGDKVNYDKMPEGCKNFWEEKGCDSLKNICDRFTYIFEPENWSHELSKCNLCVDSQPLYTVGKVAAECAAVGTYYVGTNRPFLAQRIWGDANESLEEAINGSYDRQKYYNRALEFDIQELRQNIEEHFKCPEK